jgi:hypothetical protein
MNQPPADLIEQFERQPVAGSIERVPFMIVRVANNSKTLYGVLFTQAHTIANQSKAIRPQSILSRS